MRGAAGAWTASHSLKRSFISYGRRSSVQPAWRAPARGGLEHGFHLVVVERRNRRRKHRAGGDAGAGERLDRPQPPVRRRGARLKPAGEVAVQRRDADEHGAQVFFGHGREQVEVALHQRGFGDDGERVFVRGQYLQNLARDAQFALDRLVRIGIAAQRNRADPVARVAQFLFQQPRRLRLGDQTCLEIEARRQAEVGMARARITVDTAVLATAIRIDGLRERDVGRVVARDDRARGIHADGGFEWRRRLLGAVPAVVCRFMHIRLEASVGIGHRPTSAQR